MTRVVFLCGHNAARSQMAEGFLRSLGGDRFIAESAGTVATELHPLAVRAMRDIGIDISEAERLAAFRVVRDGLQKRVRALVARLDARASAVA